MQLLDLLAHPSSISLGELAGLGIDMARNTSAQHLQRTISDAERKADVVAIASQLIRIAQQTGLSGTNRYQPMRLLLAQVLQRPLLPGDFAIQLATVAEPKPLVPSRRYPIWTWLIPSLLGWLALASWGLVIGLLIG